MSSHCAFSAIFFVSSLHFLRLVLVCTQCLRSFIASSRRYLFVSPCRTAADFAIEARCEMPLWPLFQDRHGVALTNYGRRQFLAEEGKGKGRGKGK